MKFKSNTYGDIYGPAMSLTTREEADDWWESAVENLVTRGVSPEEVEDTVSQSLGYWTGYYDAATAQQVFALFAHRNVSHPIFGKRRDITPKEALDAGYLAAPRPV